MSCGLSSCQTSLSQSEHTIDTFPQSYLQHRFSAVTKFWSLCNNDHFLKDNHKMSSLETGWGERYLLAAVLKGIQRAGSDGFIKGWGPKSESSEFYSVAGDIVNKIKPLLHTLTSATTPTQLTGTTGFFKFPGTLQYTQKICFFSVIYSKVDAKSIKLFSLRTSRISSTFPLKTASFYFSYYLLYQRSYICTYIYYSLCASTALS